MPSARGWSSMRLRAMRSVMPVAVKYLDAQFSAPSSRAPQSFKTSSSTCSVLGWRLGGWKVGWGAEREVIVICVLLLCFLLLLFLFLLLLLLLLLLWLLLLC
jgi:hypothetical protein